MTYQKTTKQSVNFTWCAGFCRDQNGSATVEFVLWFPLFVLLIALITDVSFMFNRQALMLRSVQDANRAYSVGRVTTPDAVENILLDEYRAISENVSVTSELMTGRSAGDAIRTTLSIPASDVVVLGLIANLTGMNLEVTSEQYREF